ncbi:LCP family protein [Yinghuangia seranimata]|uniref:LCP family protein n=1 Tax=Yinghuangia seranimata TaxID=408067 RepID=UPI00248C540E|nr:LCP family protein [Yinghuangia seranimata]MDI2132272.1 LCP family protein [Yinghuangia seranimata]
MNSWPPGWAEDDARRGGPPRDDAGDPPAGEPTSVLPRDRFGRPIPPPGTTPDRPAGTLPAPGAPPAAPGAGGVPPRPHSAPSPASPDAQPTQVMPGRSGVPGQQASGYPTQPPPAEAARQAAGPAVVPPRTEPRPQGPDGPSGPGGPGEGEGPRPPGRKPNWKKRILIGTAVFLALVLAFVTFTYFWLDSKIQHEDVLKDYQGRPASTAGTTWLIVGSDSREGLSKDDKQKLHTGSAEGKRTDSIMLLHKGDGGTSLISIPRDSYVEIPAYTTRDGKQMKAHKDKINAAFELGGAPLLARTVEQVTGMRLDHYAELGFAGFVDIVDALDGVNICLDSDVKDPKSGADLKAGCQTLNGPEALAFVRSRYYNPAESDFARMGNQQKFLAAVAKEAKSTSVILNPFKSFPLADAGLGALIVDDDAGLFDIYDLFKSMGGVSDSEGGTITAPVKSRSCYPSASNCGLQLDDAKMKALFDALRAGKPAPR